MTNEQLEPDTNLVSDTCSDSMTLSERARQMAKEQQASRARGAEASVLSFLDGQRSVLQEAYQYFARQSETELSLSRAGEWILDNFYVVQQSLRQVEEDMPERYYRELPVLEEGDPVGYPRIYALSRAIVCQSQSYPDVEQIERFVQAYQSVVPLTMGELWALPTMLRLAVIENLTAALLDVVEFEHEHDPAQLFVREPEPQEIPAEQVVAHAIPSLHRLLNQDWKALFEKMSLVEQTLRDDPAHVYANMDFASRDRYRQTVEQIALFSQASEQKVAQTAIQLSNEQAKAKGHTDRRDVQAENQRRFHVGYYLLDSGRSTLEAQVDCSLPIRHRVRRWAEKHALLLYLGGISLLTAALLGVLIVIGWAAEGTLAQLIGMGLVSLIPASAIAVDIVNWIVTRIVPSHTLPKLDLREGIPDAYRTMVVVPTLLGSEEEVDTLLARLELYYLGNSDRNLHFALLTDFVDAQHPHLPNDEALVERAKNGIERLNRKHARDANGPFYLFHRERRWNPGEEMWMGWERKRGKLTEFNRLLEGDTDTSYVVAIGDLEVLDQIRYVITLDADTQLPRESARRLVGTMAHPLNQPFFDPDADRVTAGYTVLQPRTEIQPTSVNQSLFASIFSGDRGIDLYSRAVSDVYQDLFGEGIYVGKGIYDVKAFECCLAGRVPENRLLSHDLFEGIHGRAGLVTDVILYEDYPPNYLSYAHRQHRWIRGDWQLLPWLLPHVPHATKQWVRNPLSTLDRWKILDNLRRSLVAPATLVLFVLGWLWLPGSPVLWSVFGALTTAMPALTNLLSSVLESFREDTSLRQGLSGVEDDMWRWLLYLVFVPYQALIAVDAIASTLVRLLITRRHLLQWTTAAHTLRIFGRDMRVAVTWMRMGGASVAALVVVVLAVLWAPQALSAAAPFLLAWLISPQIAHWISKPVERAQIKLGDQEQEQWRCLARRTWFFFEHFVGPDDHWLPPDHYQESPLGVIAHRTSPTNIGLLLLSTLGAYDLGYIGTLTLVVRLRDTFDGLEELERYRGHLLNWYDTRSLEPLAPRYVSTVDSGNLAASLIALGPACAKLVHDPIIRGASWQGFLDTCALLRRTVESLRSHQADEGIVPLVDLLRSIEERVQGRGENARDEVALLLDLYDKGWRNLDERVRALVKVHSGQLDAEILNELRVWSDRIHAHLAGIKRELDMLAPWHTALLDPPELLVHADTSEALGGAWQALDDALSTMPALAEISEVCATAREPLGRLETLLDDRDRDEREDASIDEALTWCRDLSKEIESARIGASGLVSAYQDLSTRAADLVKEMDFAFLFDAQREVFRIGYNVMTEEQDGSFYDLLASEARIASLVAIAKEDVPQNHWLHMGRPITRIDGTAALLSWSGTMFEYLMPLLLAENYADTLLGQSCRAAVERQIAYARAKGVPWGISESAFYQFDANQRYQYRAFGVPGLGLKRGLADDLVVAPYASLLALPIQPHSVLDNVNRLKELGAMGQYGLFDAIDYTRSRLSMQKECAIVRSYMAHHQGMILVTLVNILAGDCMVRRFHRDPRIQSVELLLHEQVPQKPLLGQVAEEEALTSRRAEPEISLTPWQPAMDASLPQGHVLSNGAFTTFITATGGGFAQCVLGKGQADPAGETIALTRWRADATLDEWGTWIYVQDIETGDFWPVTYQPTAGALDDLEVSFDPYKAEFRRREHEISLRMEVTVPPKDNLEIRRLALVNHGSQTRRLAITSYGQVVLAPQEMDRRHPAFNKMFIESEYVDDLGALLFCRRPRSGEEAPLHMVHLAMVRDDTDAHAGYEADRHLFLGRGREADAPLAIEQQAVSLSGTTGATLDPIMALRHEIRLDPHTTGEVAFVTLVARTRDEVLAMARRYRRWDVLERGFGQARDRSILALDELDLDAKAVERIDQLFSALMYPYRGLRAEAETLARNRKGQPGLWAFGISGDYPILLVRIKDEDEIDLATQALQAHAYWRDRQLMVDLVILNEKSTGYEQELQSQLSRLISRMDAESWQNRRGGIFVLRADQMAEQDRILLATAARVVLDGEHGEMAEQVARLQDGPVRLPEFVPTLPGARELEATPPLDRPEDLLFDNGYGGFTPDGREYAIDLGTDEWTPAPWVNVIANPEFGFLVSEVGLGCTWAGNSGENRLTPWRNDPVSDQPAEAIYLRDEETGGVWTPTPLPTRVRAPYLIRHGAGYTVFEHHSHGLKQRLRVFAAHDAPVKVMHLRLENTWDRERRLTATYYAEWVLGTARDESQQYVISEFDAETEVLLARNPYNVEFADRVAFVSASKSLHGLTADRAEFLGERGDMAHPAALDRIGLASTVEAGLDPCAAIQLHIDLKPGEVQKVHFVLGQGTDRAASLELGDRYRSAEVIESAWDGMKAFWQNVLDQITVRTPDAAMDLLLNRWLLYQAISCRLWGRSALYQSSGAYGFRDQLQDVMSMMHAAPDLAREHILYSARHQFEAGDVLHWWHPPSGRGVRTRITDDLLWLPYVTAHYVETTDDDSILDVEIPFVMADPLEPKEEERYGHYAQTEERYTLYEHCRRALERGSTEGEHGLPLMGSGDWNDGMNRVGIEGEGESVWLGWFLYASLGEFAAIAKERGDTETADTYRQRAEKLRSALEERAWDGAWYRRAYYDDGTPLGSAQNEECQIDSIAQSWSVLSGAAAEDRSRQAMQAVWERLARMEDRLLLLFAPPFDETPRDPGYIKGYPPGIRENGGQYTHAALWAVWAFAELGEGGRAQALFDVLNPIYHSDSLEKARRYGVEPYVVAADVYSIPPHTGQGGWTWYTGSSGWMYRLGIEGILGIQRRGDALRIDPRISKEWDGFEAIYRYGDSRYRIEVENPDGVEHGVQSVALDGEEQPDLDVALEDDGQEHEVRVVMGQGTGLD